MTQVNAETKPAILGAFSIEAFDPTVTTWNRWLQRLRGAFLVFGIEGEARVPYLLHYVGTAAFDVLCDRLDPEDPFAKTFDELVHKLEEFYDPAPLEIAENYKFYQRKQAEGESIQQFVAALHRLSIHCKFGAYLKTALRNQLVFGLLNKRTQARLLERKDLTYDEAVNVAVTMEMSEKGSEQMKCGGVNVAQAGIEYLKTGKKPTNKNSTEKRAKFAVDKPKGQAAGSRCKRNQSEGNSNLKCFRCGKPHLATKCPLSRDVRCHNCGKLGHLRAVCFGSRSSANQLQEILRLEHSKYRDKFLLMLEINGKNIEFEIDSGAAVTVMSKCDVKRLFPGAIIYNTNLQLITYCNRTLKSLGFVKVAVKFKSVTRNLNIYVIDLERKPLLGREWIRQLFDENGYDFLKCNASVNTISVNVKSRLQYLLDKYEKICSPEFSAITGLQATLTVKPNVTPVFIRARPVPFSMLPLVEQELNDMEAAGIIEKVATSRWATPIVPILKRNGKIRICGDYKVTVNPNLIVDDHPLPTVDELFTKLSQGKKFSKIDLKQAYLQLELASRDREMLTLSTCKGLYRVNRLMYGIAPGPTIWQREMEKIFRGIEGIAIFIDDIIVTGETDEAHLIHLEEVLKRLHQHNIRINLEKSNFFLNRVNYCGYMLDRCGVRKEKQKMEAIEKMCRPTNISEIRAFTGMINYYGRFIPNLSSILRPLNRLLCKNVAFKWTPECERAFKQAKLVFTSDNVLVHFNSKLPLILATDASPYGVGAVLSHRYPDGTEKVIQYASQAFSNTQAKYSQIDKEAYAIIFGVKKFFQFLYGNRFTLETDHRPLVQIFSPTKSLPIYSAMRMQHYAIFLQGFNYDIRYRRSEDHANADCLSRLPLKQYNDMMDVVDVFQMESLNTLPISAQTIAEETKRDPELADWLQVLKSGRQIHKLKSIKLNQAEFSLQKGVIMRGHKAVIPRKLRLAVKKELHAGHFGIVRMKSLARNYCWWPGIDRDIEELVRNCAECRMHMNNPPKAAMHVWQQPSAPMQRVHLDFAGPFVGKMFLVMVDAYSKWPEVHSVKNITAGTTIAKCRQIFASYGLPQVIVTDNGRTFTSHEFRGFLKKNGITHKLTSPYYPATNGQAERFVQTFKQALKRTKCSSANVDLELSKFLLQYRSVPHTITNKSPAEIFLNRKLRTRLDLILPCIEDKCIENPAQPLTKVFACGERVACRNYTKNSKWKFGIVTRKIGKLHYEIKIDDGRIWTRHLNQMRLIGRDTPKMSEPADDDDDDVHWEIERQTEQGNNISPEDSVPQRQSPLKPVEQPPQQAQVEIQAPLLPRNKNEPRRGQQSPRRSVRIKKRPDYLAKHM